MSRLKGPGGEPLSVFSDGEVVVTYVDGTEMVESFENLGQELEIELDSTLPVESIVFRQTNAKVAKSREVVENHG